MACVDHLSAQVNTDVHTVSLCVRCFCFLHCEHNRSELWWQLPLSLVLWTMLPGVCHYVFTTSHFSILEQTDFNSLQIIMLQYVPRIQFTVLPLCCMLNLSLVLYQFSLPPGCVLNMSLVLDQFTVCHQVVC